LEEFQPMSRYTDEVLELLEGGSDKRLHTSAWYWLAWYASSDVSQTIVAFERSIELARAAGEAPRLGPEFGIMADRDFMLVIALWAYATFLLEHGEVERAAPSLAECLELFRKRENHYEIADGLGTSGLMALLQGDIAQAHTLFQEAVTIATTFNFPEVLACWQPLLGLVTLYGGDATEARRLLCESLGFCLDLKDKGLLARSCNCLAEVALWEGELDEAKQWLTQSLAHYADPQRITIYEIERLWVAARLAMGQQQYQRAATLFGLADQAHSQIHYAIAGPMRALAEAALATVRAALDVELFAKAFAAGQEVSFEEAFATLLSPTQPTSVPIKI
jgi:tetratricopeptide (TPR) repeat protein